MAAGFGAIFGTPLAGAVFAMEVLTYGRLEWKAALPCLAAAYLAHGACLFWGIHHTAFHIDAFDFSAALLGKLVLASLAFGMAGLFFASLEHRLGAWFKAYLPFYWLRPLVGASALIVLTLALGTRDYLGLGLPGMVAAFSPGGAAPFAWLWKTLSTALTLCSGFKGGEVTPLFFIGASLGNQLAGWLNGPCSLFAGLGLVAIFSAATNTPLACTIMGAELFGWAYLPYLALACYLAWACRRARRHLPCPEIGAKDGI